MNTINMKAENRTQAEAFRRMQGDVLELIWIYGADFRQIITEFKNGFDRIPSADDLIWIESQRQGRDITRAA